MVNLLLYADFTLIKLNKCNLTICGKLECVSEWNLLLKHIWLTFSLSQAWSVGLYVFDEDARLRKCFGAKKINLNFSLL
jgi:hypothetical protein